MSVDGAKQLVSVYTLDVIISVGLSCEIKTWCRFPPQNEVHRIPLAQRKIFS